MQVTTKLRSSQEDILNYESGMLGISAVPGSGKTWTLSALAAQLLVNNRLSDDQEILIVTLVNSAVDNFYQRIRNFLNQQQLLPYGFRVRTLHGLAHDIVRERPELVGLDNDFQILDNGESTRILQDVVSTLISERPNLLQDYLLHNLEEHKLHKLYKHEIPDLIQDLGLGFIRSAKNKQFSPVELITLADSSNVSLPLAQLGIEIYDNYQSILKHRGAVDFDDLIRLAIKALELDAELLQRLRHRWPIILEDEAQDSSLLQEKILRRLVGINGNWVRVGDPNQAIYETFTTANPRYLREFITDPGVIHKNLSHSGRSTQSIINLANYLVQWTKTDHPTPQVRDALQSPPDIQPTEQGDPQPNPPDNPKQIRILKRGYKPAEEIEVIANSLQKWLPINKDRTVAVLIPTNIRANQMVDTLRERNIPFNDSLLRISSGTRSTMEKINYVLKFLADPLSTYKLTNLYDIVHQVGNNDKFNQQQGMKVKELLRKISRMEEYIWPRRENDWMDGISDKVLDEDTLDELYRFRKLIQRWQSSLILPVDQIILAISQDLLHSANDLAIAQKLAVLLRRSGDEHTDWSLPDFIHEIDLIVNNQRRLLGLSDDDIGFDPEKYKGVVVIATMHKAKGLEWDRVYLLSVNNYDYPGDTDTDPFIAEKWFIRDHLNLQAESIAQLDSLTRSDDYASYKEGVATMNGRLDYIRERLRLLYVGITRAKQELIITWNVGRQNNLKPTVSLESLYNYLHDVLNHETK